MEIKEPSLPVRHTGTTKNAKVIDSHLRSPPRPRTLSHPPTHDVNRRGGRFYYLSRPFCRTAWASRPRGFAPTSTCVDDDAVVPAFATALGGLVTRIGAAREPVLAEEEDPARRAGAGVDALLGGASAALTPGRCRRRRTGAPSRAGQSCARSALRAAAG